MDKGIALVHRGMMSIGNYAMSLKLGAVSSPESAPYALLKGDRIQKAAPSGECFTPIKSIHIQPVNDTCLEFLLSYKHTDTILVFTHDHSPSGEYSLLSRLDIYPRGSTHSFLKFSLPSHEANI